LVVVVVFAPTLLATWMVLSWNTLLEPSGVEESTAVGLDGQDRLTVAVFTGLPAEFGHVTPENKEGFTSSALNNFTAPYAPFIGTVSVPALETIVSVADRRVVESGTGAVKCKVTWHVFGAVIAPVQEFPSITKSPASGPPTETPSAGGENDTLPVPLILTITKSGALVWGLAGVGVTVGTPNDKSPGETETDCACAAGILTHVNRNSTTSIYKRILFSSDFILRPPPGRLGNTKLQQLGPCGIGLQSWDDTDNLNWTDPGTEQPQF
jgi:hypothetical protein